MLSAVIRSTIGMPARMRKVLWWLAQAVALTFWLWPMMFVLIDMSQPARTINWQFTTVCLWCGQFCLGGILYFMVLDQQKNDELRRQYEDERRVSGDSE